MNLAWCVLAVAVIAADDPTSAKSDEYEIWPMRSREAIRIAFENSKSVRVTFAGDRNILVQNCWGDPVANEPVEKRPRPLSADRWSIVIEPVDPDASVARFRSEVTAIIRPVEESYWNLAEAHVGLWAADRAFQLAENLVEIEESIGDPSNPQDLIDLADAYKRLHQFHKNIVSANVDVTHAERRLRKLMGVSESDQRRIIPVTPPTEAPLAFAREACLDVVMTKRPDRIGRKPFARLVGDNLIEALRTLDATSPLPEPKHDEELKAVCMRPEYEGPGSSCGQNRPAEYPVLSSPLFPRQVIHQTTRALARAVLKVDSDYESYAKAKRLRVAANQELELQRVNCTKDRISADRYLDAVEQYATLVVNERHCLALYNSALTFVNECQGTLLEDHGIVVTRPTGKIANHAVPLSTEHTDETRSDVTEETRP
jgi:hypothetical protein